MGGKRVGGPGWRILFRGSLGRSMSGMVNGVELSGISNFIDYVGVVC